jgi:hypothetical protein
MLSTQLVHMSFMEVLAGGEQQRPSLGYTPIIRLGTPVKRRAQIGKGATEYNIMPVSKVTDNTVRQDQAQLNLGLAGSPLGGHSTTRLAQPGQARW